MRRQRPLDSAQFHAGARRIVIQESAERGWVAGRNRIRTKGPQRCQALASGEASREGCNTVKSWNIPGAGVEAVLRNDLLIKTAKEKHPVLDERATDGESAKLVIGPGD